MSEKSAKEKKIYLPEEIELLLLQERDEEACSIIPTFLQHIWLEIGYIGVIAVTPEKEVIGLSLMTYNDLYRKLACVEFWYVKDSYVGSGIENRLLTVMVGLAKGLGAKYFYSAYITTKKDPSDRLMEMLQGLDLVGRETSIALRYSFAQLLESKLYNKNSSLKKVFPRVVFADELLPVTLKRFGLYSTQVGFPFDCENFDEDYACFYVENGEIAAAIVGGRPSDDILVLKNYHISPDVSRDYVQPALVMAILEKAADRMMPKDSVVFEVEGEKEKQAFSSLLGDSDKPYFVHKSLFKINETCPSIKLQDMEYAQDIEYEEQTLSGLLKSGRMTDRGDMWEIVTGVLYGTVYSQPGALIIRLMQKDMGKEVKPSVFPSYEIFRKGKEIRILMMVHGVRVADALVGLDEEGQPVVRDLQIDEDYEALGYMESFNEAIDQAVSDYLL